MVDEHREELAELALLASEVTGDSYRYEPLEDADWEAGWRARGHADWQVEAGLSSYAALRSGELDVVSDDYRTLAGSEPLTTRELVEKHVDQLPLARLEGSARERQ